MGEHATQLRTHHRSEAEQYGPHQWPYAINEGVGREEFVVELVEEV